MRATAIATSLAAAAAVLPGAAAAQSFAPQPQLYQLSVDAADARAVWLHPAGLSRRREASFGGLLTAERGGTGRLTQYGLTIASGGLGIGWQHDRRGAAIDNDTWTVGYAVGTVRAGLGVSRSWYRGTGTRDGSFAIGARLAPRPALELSLLVRDAGSPVILGDTLKTTLLPAAALNLFGGRARLGGEWEIVTGEWGTSAVRAGAAASLVAGLAISARGDFSRTLGFRGLAVGLTWGNPRARIAAFGTDVRSDSDAVGAWGALVRSLDAPSRRPGRRPGRR